MWHRWLFLESTKFSRVCELVVWTLALLCCWFLPAFPIWVCRILLIFEAIGNRNTRQRVHGLALAFSYIVRAAPISAPRPSQLHERADGWGSRANKSNAFSSGKAFLKGIRPTVLWIHMRTSGGSTVIWPMPLPAAR